MKKWLLRQCANTLAFLMFPAILYGAYLVDQEYTVVSDFRIVTQVVNKEGVLIEGTMNKRRPCRLIDVVSVVKDEARPVVFMERGVPPTYKRPTGVQKWGPWLVAADPNDGVHLHAYYRCHDGWEHSADLTSFVVGVQ